MEQIYEALKEVLASKPYKLVLSSGKGCEYQKIVVQLKGDYYQIEKYTQKQVFHENIQPEQLGDSLAKLLELGYRQLNSYADAEQMEMKISKKGKVLLNRRKQEGAAAKAAPAAHNKEKNYILKEGAIIPPLVDLGIFTPDGRVVKSMYDKYRQINRFIEIVDDAVSNWEEGKELTIVDFGCGKSYLTFILYYYFAVKRGMDATIIGYDLKADVVKRCGEIAKKYGYSGLEFVHADVTRDVLTDRNIDMIVTLHACDVATDFALHYAIQKKADFIFSVPCCQHEVNSSIHKGGDLDILLKYGIIKERVSALLTDSIRASVLEDMGYTVDMIEFIDFDHSPKNIMIRAKRNGKPSNKGRQQAQALSDAYCFKQTLLELCK